MNKFEIKIIVLILLWCLIVDIVIIYSTKIEKTNIEKECLKCYEKGFNESLLEIDSAFHQKLLIIRKGDTLPLLNLKIIKSKKQDTVTYLIY